MLLLRYLIFYQINEFLMNEKMKLAQADKQSATKYFHLIRCRSIFSLQLRQKNHKDINAQQNVLRTKSIMQRHITQAY